MDKQHLIIIEVDDELTDIYEKIKATKEKKIHLFVPRSSILFQSSLNLKILKRKSDTLQKELTIITKDRQQIKRIEEMGITALEDKTFDPFEKSKPKIDTGANPTTKSMFQKIKEKMETIDKNINNKPFIFSKPSRRPLFIFFSISIALFAFILYVALPSATISIKPTLKPQKSTLNIEMVHKDKLGKILSEEDRLIPFYPLTVSYERTIKLTPTGKIFKGASSTGRIILFNASKDSWPIVANSRLQTNDGLVFLTRNFVTVPGGTQQNPGKITVDVAAREKDAFDVGTGARGNVGPSRFKLPALSAFNQELLWGESKEAFKGGTDDFDYVVTKDDLTIAKQKIQSDLENMAIAELKKSIATQDTSGGTVFKLFDRSDKMITKTMINAEVKAKEGDKVPDITVWGSMTSTGYYYNEKDLETILTNNLILRHISPTERILKIKENSLQINEVLDANPEIGKVKVNVSLEGIIAYDFLNTKLDLVKAIRDNVVGKNIKDAETYINNLKEISEAHISIWPLWSPTLPSIPENIKIDIIE